jgi:hypothetical protein
MTLLMRSLLICLAILSGSIICSGQAPPPPPPPVAPTRTVGKAKIYRSKHGIAVKSAFLRRDKFSMSAIYETPPQEATQPKTVQILFQSFSRGLKYKDSRQITITLDGETLKSEARSLMSSCDPQDSGECYEMLSSPPLPYEDLLRILKAKKVSITLVLQL